MKVSKFKPFDKVLVRNSFSETWEPEIFSTVVYHFGKSTDIKFKMIDGREFRQCILYEENKKLNGTLDVSEGLDLSVNIDGLNPYFVRIPDFKIEDINNCNCADKTLIRQRHIMFATREEAEEYASYMLRCRCMSNEDFNKLKLGKYYGYC